MSNDSAKIKDNSSAESPKPPQLSDIESWPRDGWSEFFDKHSMSPPDKINKTMPQIEERAEEMMRGAFGGKRGWDDLPTHCKAMMAWMLNERFEELFESKEKAQNAMVEILVSEDMKLERSILWSFVQKGDDEVVPDSNGGLAYQAFLEKYRDIFAQGSDQWTSIFRKHEHLKPLVKIHSKNPMVRLFMTFVRQIYYTQVIRKGRDGEPDLEQLSTNVSKAMHCLMTRQEKWDAIFRSWGFQPRRTLGKIMLQNGLNKEKRLCHLFGCIVFLAGDDLDELYSLLNMAFRHGPLFLEGFRWFDEYEKSDKCTKYPFPPEKRAKPMLFCPFTRDMQSDAQHTVTVVGAGRTTDNDEWGGLAVMIQEGCHPFAFKAVGINVLMQMGLTRFNKFYRDIDLPSGDFFDASPEVMWARCGGSEGIFESWKPSDHAEFYKRGGRYQQLQHLFNPDPNGIAPWDDRNYPEEQDENVAP